MRILGIYVKEQWYYLLIRKPKTPLLSLPLLLNLLQRRKFAPFFFFCCAGLYDLQVLTVVES